MDVERLIECSKNYPDEDELKNNLSTLNKKLSSLTLRTEHQILVTKRAKNHHEKNQAQVDKYKNSLMEIEEWLKMTILTVERLNTQPKNEVEAEERINKLEDILKELEDKEAEVKRIHDDCEKFDGFSDIQKFVKDLLLGLSSNIQVIRENQRIIRENLLKAREQQDQPQEVVEQVEIKTVAVPESAPEIEEVKKVGTTMSTQTSNEPFTDNIMVKQSMSSEGETIQIYNMQSNDSKSDDRNVIVEAKYIRDSDDHRKSSELILKNVPKQFETTFVEPDETTTEIIVDPDGSKRIIVRKMTKSSTQQIVTTHEEVDTGTLPEHIRSQLTQSGVTHDVIMGTSDEQGFEPVTDIDESTIHAVIEHVTHRVIRKTRRIIKKIVIIDGVEQITEEIVEEPDEVEEYNEDNLATQEEISPAEIVEIIEQPEIVSESHEIIKEDVPQSEPEVVKEPEVVEEISQVEITDEKIEESSPEGENDTQQVFDKITEEHVNDLTVDEVDKSAPVEDLKEIWPAYEMPITNTTTSLSPPPVADALAELDEKSHEIWPQNLATGSNVALENYHFESTVDKTIESNIDESPVVANVELDEVPQVIEILPTEDEKETQPEEIVEQPEIVEEIQEKEQPGIVEEIQEEEQPEIVEEVKNVEPQEIVEEVVKQNEPLIEPRFAVDEEESTPEVKIDDEKPTEIKSHSDENVSIVKEIETVFEKAEKEPEISLSPPKSPSSRPMSPQIATITITKTMTFLEQEKINSQATMVIRTEAIEEMDISEVDRSLTESVLNTSEMHKEIQPAETLELVRHNLIKF